MIVTEIREPMPTTTAGPGRRLFAAPGERVVRAYYGFLAVLLTATFIAQCILTHREGRSLVNTFSYFTMQSNALVLITFAILAVRPNVAGRVWSVLRLGSLCGITVTGIVYATVLAPYVHLTGWAMAYNCVFHYVMPAASVIGFVFVGPRIRLRAHDMIYFAWPVLWLVYTMLRGALLHPEFTGFGEPASHYPYKFLDIDQVPLVEVVGSITVISLLLVGVGVAYISLSRRLARRTTVPA
jgi:hypothetical protein